MLTPLANIRHEQRTVNFNATTSLFNYGALNSAYNSNLAQSWLALIRPTGAGEGNFGYFASKVIASSATGMRWMVDHNSGSPRIVWGVASGTSGPSQSAPAGSITYGRWIWVAATYAAGTAASGIRLYQGTASLSEVSSYPSPVDGSGSVGLNLNDNFVIGNRDGGDRTFNGDIAMVVRWPGVLTLGELNDAVRRGPLTVRADSVLLCWAGGQDIGPRKRRTTSVTARGLGSPRRYPIVSQSAPLWAYEVAGGGAQNISPGGIASLEAFGSAMVTPGAVAVTASAIDSAEAFGSAVVSQGGVSIICSGIATAETFGATVVIPGAVSVVCSGVASAEAFGDAVVTAGGSIIVAGGIASLEAFGSHTLVPGGVTVTCSGVASAEAFGAHVVAVGAQYVTPGGISTGEAFGAHTLTVGPVTIVCSGIASLEAFGAALVAGGVVTIYTPGATWHVRESRTLSLTERRTWTRH